MWPQEFGGLRYGYVPSWLWFQTAFFSRVDTSWHSQNRMIQRMVQNDPSLKHSFVVFEIRHHLQNCIGTWDPAKQQSPETLRCEKRALKCVSCWPTYRSTLCMYICIVYVCLYKCVCIYNIYNVNTLIIYHILYTLNYIQYRSRDIEREREREREREPDIIYDNALHVWSYVYDRIYHEIEWLIMLLMRITTIKELYRTVIPHFQTHPYRPCYWLSIPETYPDIPSYYSQHGRLISPSYPNYVHII